MFTKRKLGCNSLILFICNVVCVMLLCYIDIKCKKLRPAITVCINQDSHLLAAFRQRQICFLPGWSGAEIKYTLHFSLHKRRINQFSPAHQSRQLTFLVYIMCLQSALAGVGSTYIPRPMYGLPVYMDMKGSPTKVGRHFER